MHVNVLHKSEQNLIFIRLNDNTIINRKSVVRMDLYSKNDDKLFTHNTPTRYYIDFIHSDINLGGNVSSYPFSTSISFHTEEDKDQFINDNFFS